MAAVVVGGDHVAAPAYERISLRKRADAVAVAVEAVADARRFGIRRGHGSGIDDECSGGGGHSRQCPPPTCGKTRGCSTQRTLLPWHVARPDSLDQFLTCETTVANV